MVAKLLPKDSQLEAGLHHLWLVALAPCRQKSATESNCSQCATFVRLYIFGTKEASCTQGDLTQHVYPYQSHLRLDSPTTRFHASFFVFTLGAWNRSRFAQRNSQQEFILHLFTCLGLIISNIATGQLHQMSATSGAPLSQVPSCPDFGRLSCLFFCQQF